MPGACPLWCATTTSPHNIDGASPLNVVDMQGPTARRTESIDVAIIGGGPAGLAAGAALRKTGADFVILERKPTVGSSWRTHYERLHLHTIKQLSASVSRLELGDLRATPSFPSAGVKVALQPGANRLAFAEKRSDAF